MGVGAVEEPPRLEQLLEPEDVRVLLVSLAAMSGCGLRLVTASGFEMVRAGRDGGPAHVARPVEAAGVVLGKLDVIGEEPGRVRMVADAVLGTLAVTLGTAVAHHVLLEKQRVALEVAQDEITEKTSRLAGAVERLNELDRVKSNFLATISHELRTPLTSVIGYSEMLIEGMAGAITAEQREYVETILAKADNLLQIITGILEVARMEQGVLRVERTPVSIGDLVHGVAATLSSEAARRSIALSLPAGGAPRVLGDTRKLRQVVTHLLTNALKFTPQGGGVTVEIGIGPLSPHRAEHLGVRVSVRDTGIGIPPAALAHIFEPFYQVDQSSTRAYGGTGLGLSLAKSYVEAHGGSIWVDSRPGEGSTFTVSLPAVPEEIERFASGARAS